jgi:hypothetical protein
MENKEKPQKNTALTPKNIILGLLGIGLFFYYTKDPKKGNYSSAGSSSQSCIGNEGCISQVRSNFTNTGKTILGEQYLGDGKFGISFLDSQHYGASYNATVSTDCNCNVSVGSVSTVQ